MSELLDKQVNVQKENLKNTSSVYASSRKPTKKVCDENESRNKEKNDGCLKIFVGRKEFIRLVWKAHVMDIKQLQVNNS